MKDEPYQQSSKFSRSLPSEQSNGHNRRDVGDLRCSGEEFGDDESSRRLSQFNKGLPNSESPSLKFVWNRLLLGPDPSRMSIDSNQSSYLSTLYGFTSNGVSTRRQISEQVRTYSLKPNSLDFTGYSLSPNFNLNLAIGLCDKNYMQPFCEVNGFECKEDSPVSLKKDIHVASEKSPDLNLSESTQEDYISLEGYTDITDDIELTCEEHFSRNDEVQGDLYKHNLSSEEDSEILLTDNHEDKQCLDEFTRANESYATMLKPKCNIQKKPSKIISLSHVISTDTTHLLRRDPTDMNDDIELPCEEHLLRIDEVQGDLHKRNLFSEEDSEILVTSKDEHTQCLDESKRSNEPYSKLMKPKRDIQKKSSKIISLINVLSINTTHFVRRGPKEVNARITRWRNSENSEESNQLVNSAFLKYFKKLNENSAQRKSFTENSGRMKCSVCGSGSKVFVDCNSLIAHAFGCEIPELRTKHLGFHKALCALIGCKSGTHLERSWRYHKKLSDDEAIALKEDLIIWPPVIIIHNNSIQSKNPDDRILVSNEELCTMLKEMGYVGSVCRGKPVNQSIMVVKFKSTLHGLQEAERLHKYYCETNHGRSDLQRVEVSTVNSKIESVLFGYLGLAEDLDKLDFETKKKCFLKSKKEIQEIVDATLLSLKSEI